ncbi:TIGR02611 family protein [Corynebacterium sp. sy017]|uniref:TIGR02611 family protein n=1 Tax=unclassified Corynebacterium TaxID=2624378 RepID=UPI0011861022|nr:MULTISPECIES: TIGR02611 family protein [unclassified Corynebacterium]MBP3088647.1 TIGR02611 family protein [Corynebacterium sp. sy017]TSD91939.1 TIGR02611 family protein [Corynebacterium sp. SY003]
MGKMRDAVSEKIDKIERHHAALKTRRFGFLVRPLTLFLGSLITIIGIVTIPFPGPGWLTVFIGVGILSLEAHWAQRLLKWGIHKYEQFFLWYKNQNKKIRYGIIFTTCLCVWICVAVAAYISWKCGAIPALDPIMTKFF